MSFLKKLFSAFYFTGKAVLVVAGIMTVSYLIAFHLVTYELEGVEFSDINYGLTVVPENVERTYNRAYGLYDNNTRPEQVSNLSSTIVDACGSVDCVLEEFDSFVKRSIEYTKLEDLSPPLDILEKGVGDCKHKAVLYASLVKSVDWESEFGREVKPYWVFQDKHICVATQEFTELGLDSTGLKNVEYFNCLNREFKSSIPVIDRG